VQSPSSPIQLKNRFIAMNMNKNITKITEIALTKIERGKTYLTFQISDVIQNSSLKVECNLENAEVHRVFYAVVAMLSFMIFDHPVYFES
jgi:hypothetical protein